MTRASKNLKKLLIRILILFIIFLIAVAVYFAWSFQHVEAEYTVYTSMDEPELPVIYVEQGGQDINVMHGYRQDMGNAAVSDSITVLPPDRSLSIRIDGYGNTITGLSYEIRSLDLSHFVERTEVKEVRTEGMTSYAELPIQNLISKDRQYLLRIQLDLGEESINYYTRMIWTDDEYISGMIAFARDFSTRTFDYEAARELTTYIETSDTADVSNLGEADIHSSFSHLTWGSSDMRMESDPFVTVKEYNGIMSEIEVSYVAARDEETDSLERYMVTDQFTLRQGSERIYLMNYERKADQIFDGSPRLFSGKRIDLGISSDGMLQDMKSEGGRYIAFKSNRELWCYDQEDRVAVSVFSFRSGTDDGVRSNYGKHDIKILSMEDTGILDFVVYGYMNRGVHEGYNGIAYYRYDLQNDILTELFFMPIAQSFDRISYELNELCRKGGNDMLYLKQLDAVVAIDLNSLEMVSIASGLRPGTYAVNETQSGFAWETGELHHAERIRLLDLESGSTRTIEQEGDEYLRVLDFSNDDLIIGRAGRNDEFSVNGTMRSLPMYRIEILNRSLGLEKEYSRESIYIDDVTVEGNRIKLRLYRKNETGGYDFYGEDTVVSTEAPTGVPSSIFTENDPDKKKVYYVSLDNEIRTTRSLKVRAPEQISYERSAVVELDSDREAGISFLSYANGRLVMRADRLSDAIDSCYEEMGHVTDQNGRIVYNRADRTESMTIANPMQTAYPLIVALESFSGNMDYEDESLLVLDAYGLDLTKLLYFVYKGMPVAVSLPDGSYAYLYGYNNDQIRIYMPASGDESVRELSMSRDEAEQWLFSMDYNTICAVAY